MCIGTKIKRVSNRLCDHLTGRNLSALIQAREQIKFLNDVEDGFDLKLEEVSSRGLLGSGVGCKIIHKYLIGTISRFSSELCNELASIHGSNKRIERILEKVIEDYFITAARIYPKAIISLPDDVKKKLLERFEIVERDHLKLHFIHRFRTEKMKNRLSAWSEWKVRFIFMVLGALLTKIDSIFELIKKALK